MALNTQNLIPNSERTPEELREMTRKAGIASGKARRLKKTQRETLREIMALELTEEEGRMLMIMRGLDPNFSNAANFAAVRQAAQGDIESLRYIRDTIGEKPREGIEIGNLDDTPLELIDLSKLSDEQLKRMIAKRKDPESE